MRLKMLSKDLKRNKITVSVLLVFVAVSALLFSGAVSLLTVAAGAADRLFEAARAPHFIQMHAGSVDQTAIDGFTRKSGMVLAQQSAEMLNIDATNITFDGHERQNTVMDMGFVVQNKSFDFLLGLDNGVLRLESGEAAVPIYFMKQYGLKPGDTVTIQNGKFHARFVIAGFVRDAVMNPSIVYSKRFVVSEADYGLLKANLGETEYLIEFLLKDINRLAEFARSYEQAGLPDQGVAIDYNLLKSLNMLSDGIIVLVLMLLSSLFTGISLLCLKFVMTASMEEDYREIGVMKALGIRSADIGKLYIAKYLAVAAVACIIGYLASFAVSPLFTANITLYMGESNGGAVWLPLLAALFIFLVIGLYAGGVLRRFKKISAVAAINAQSMGTGGKKRRLYLSRRETMGVNLFTALNDICVNIKFYVPLFLVFVLCCFIVMVPLNLYNTVKSPDFITYMGAAKSDLRIDLRRSEDISERFDRMAAALKADKSIEKFAASVTCNYKVRNSEGNYDNLRVEIGDFTAFPIAYLHGNAPRQQNEIALSYLNAKEMGKTAGDTVVLLLDGKESPLTVSGIYQDITNGGKTAKALLDYRAKDPLWYVVVIDLKPGTDISAKAAEYAKTFYPARVTDLEEYLSQTFGQTTAQLKTVVAVAAASALLITVLITALFIRMLTAKDRQEILTMKRLGFSPEHIGSQYLYRSLIVLTTAVLLGMLLSNTAGQSLAGALFSFMGAAEIRFIINPFTVYLFCPLVALLVVFTTTLSSVKASEKFFTGGQR